MSQALILKNIALFIRILNQHKSDTSDSEKLIKELSYGHCHGFAICHGVMDQMDKLAWWESALEKIANWHDGSDIKETIHLEKKLFQLVSLPDSETPSTTLLDIFIRVLNYVVSYQIYRHFDIESQFTPATITQRNSLTPASGYLEYTNNGVIQRVAHHNSKVLDPELSPDLLKFLLDANTVRFHVCLIASAEHIIRVGYTGTRWFIYDPNTCHSSTEKMRILFSGIDELLDALKAIFNRREVYRIDHFTLHRSYPILFPRLAAKWNEELSGIHFLHLKNLEIHRQLPGILLNRLNTYATYQRGDERVARALARCNTANISGLHFLLQVAVFDPEPLQVALQLAMKSNKSTEILVKALAKITLGRSELHTLTERCPQIASSIFQHLVDTCVDTAELIRSLQRRNPRTGQIEMSEILCMQSVDREAIAILLSFCAKHRDGNKLLLTTLKSGLLQRLFVTGLHKLLTADALFNLFEVAMTAPQAAADLMLVLSSDFQGAPTLVALHDPHSFSAIKLFEKIATTHENSAALLECLATQENSLLTLLLPQLTDTEHVDLIRLLLRIKHKAAPALLRRCLLAANKSGKSGLNTLCLDAPDEVSRLLATIKPGAESIAIYVQLLDHRQYGEPALNLLNETIKTGTGKQEMKQLLQAATTRLRFGDYGVHIILKFAPQHFPLLLRHLSSGKENRAKKMADFLACLCEDDIDGKTGLLLLDSNDLDSLLNTVSQSIAATEQLAHYLTLENTTAETHFIYLAQHHAELLQRIMRLFASHTNTQHVLRHLLDRKYAYRNDSPLRRRKSGIDVLRENARNVAIEFEKYASQPASGSSENSFAMSESADDSQCSMLVLDSIVSEESEVAGQILRLNAPSGIAQRIELTTQTLGGNPNQGYAISKALVIKHGLKQLPGLYLLAHYGSPEALQYIRSQDKDLYQIIIATRKIAHTNPDEFMTSALSIKRDSHFYVAEELLLRNPSTLAGLLGYLTQQKKRFVQLLVFFINQFPLCTEYLATGLQLKIDHQKIGGQLLLEHAPKVFFMALSYIAKEQPSQKSMASSSDFCISRRNFTEILKHHVHKTTSTTEVGLFSTRRSVTALLNMATAKNKVQRGTMALHYLEHEEDTPLRRQISGEFKKFLGK
jgi:hypothetical protein